VADQAQSINLDDRPHHRPLSVVITICVSVFLAEVLVMLILDLLPPLPPLTEALVDGSLLLVYLVPIFYLLIFRPLMDQVRYLEEAGKRLRVAARDAEAANLAKTEFLRNTSHELRTPLNVIIGALDLLQTRDLDPREERYVGEALRSAGELLALIDALLTFARARDGKIEVRPERIDVGELVDQLVVKYSETLDGAPLTIHADLPEEAARIIVTDRVLLAQALSLLLDNAVKYTQEGEIRVTANAMAGEDGKPMIRISVADTGIGIPRDKLEQIFESFTQVDASSTREHEGMGLGLALCRSLAQALGGSSGGDSEEGRGSKFWIDVPR
jgi:signal transduction histidine kinase